MLNACLYFHTRLTHFSACGYFARLTIAYAVVRLLNYPTAAINCSIVEAQRLNDYRSGLRILAPVKFAFGKNLKRRHYNAQLAFSTKASLRTGSRFFVPVKFCYSKTYITWA